MSKRPLQASIAPDFLFKGRIDVHDTKSFLLAFIAPDFSENFLNKLETFSMRARHITGLAHNEAVVVLSGKPLVAALLLVGHELAVRHGPALIWFVPWKIMGKRNIACLLEDK